MESAKAVTDPVSDDDSAASTSLSPSHGRVIMPQTPLINDRSPATELQAGKIPSYLKQQQSSSSIDITPSQVSGCDEPDVVVREAPLRRSRRQFSLFSNTKSMRAESEASVGKFCGMKGKYNCWEAKGPAEASFKILSKDIAALLERACGPVPASSQVIYDIFMVGETPSTAVPQIMFSCRKPGPRKEAMEILKKSGILSGYPGFETGHWPFPPHILDPRLLAFGEEPDDAIQRTTTKVLRFLAPLHESFTAASFPASSPTISAIRLCTIDPSKAGGASLKATVGSLTYFSGRSFYVSVSHAFGESVDGGRVSPSVAADDDGNSEFEFGGLDDGEQEFDEFDEEKSEMDDSGSMTSKSSGSREDSINDFAFDESLESLGLFGSDASLTTQIDIKEAQNRDNFNPKLSKPSTPLVTVDCDQTAIVDSATIYLESADLDYALLESSSDNNLFPTISTLPVISSRSVSTVPPGETRVITVTGSNGLLSGILSGRPSYVRLLHSKTFQEVYTVTVNGPLMAGDSGSIVMNSDTRKIYGHIALGSTVSRTAYIIPASSILKDLKSREEMSTRTAIEDATSIQQTEASKEEGSSRASKLQWQPDSKDIPRACSKSTQKIGLLAGTSLCTYNLTPLYEWKSIFSTRREEIQYSKEDEPLIDQFVPGEGTVIRFFMKSYDESDACLPRADKVEEYCFGATLEALQDEREPAGELKVPCALLDDRSSAGGKEQARKDKGPLTASSLYRELKRPRFHFATSPGSTRRKNSQSQNHRSFPTSGRPLSLALNSSSDTESDSSDATLPLGSDFEYQQSENPESDAERRKIFITNLDRWSIYALIGTASESQALGLRDTIYKHLAFESFIGVTFPPTYLPMFQMSFHIPFFVWRTSDRACEDHRRDANATRLRQTQDVSYLHWRNSDSPSLSNDSSYLYEAQISCLIAGSDDSHWVAYGFVDTYFDHVDEARETVENYHEEGIKEGGMKADPLTFGVIDSNLAIKTPREYFLAVFRIRIKQAKTELEQVVINVEKSIKEYERTYRHTMCVPRGRFSFRDGKEYDEYREKLRHWIVCVRRLTNELLQHVSKLVDACEKFSHNHAAYFQNLPGRRVNGVEDLSLRAIQTTFEELELLKMTLQSLAHKCADFSEELKLHLILEHNELGNLEHKIAMGIKTLGITTMFILPIALSAQILSMDQSFISVVPAHFGSFIVLTFMFIIIGILIHIVLQYPSWCWEVVMALAGQQKRKGFSLQKRAQEGLG